MVPSLPNPSCKHENVKRISVLQLDENLKIEECDECRNGGSTEDNYYCIKIKTSGLKVMLSCDV